MVIVSSLRLRTFLRPHSPVSQFLKTVLRFEGSRVLTLRKIHCFNKTPSFYSDSQFDVYTVPSRKLFSDVDCVPQVSTIINECSRRLYSKKRNVVHSDSESSDDELDIIDKYDKNCKIIKKLIPSLRLDSILKTGLGLARNKVDLAFYESKIRVNKEKVYKKSQRINIGDEIDIIKGISPMNPDFLNVSRVEIISAKPDDDEEGIIVKLKRFKSLQIENYETALFKQE